MQIHQYSIKSGYLNREVVLDTYFTEGTPKILLLVNDGQDLAGMLTALPAGVMAAGIYAGTQRKQEYGTAGIPDYMGQGALAEVYTRFVTEELLPFLEAQYPSLYRQLKAFAGFSLGGLSALDIAWHHPDIFQLAGVFSGALWWRSRAVGPGYSDAQHRIMHQQIRSGEYHPGQQFFFECGTADETADRNNNGVIDSIDDTRDLINELLQKGYQREKDIFYIEIPGGRHDITTWKSAMEVFLQLPFFH
ncbi:alpha/beta hydrolase-fold protein [Chitinophaga sp. 212800010-3]|uniref:alpha/beta hydrolase n=1 Tax=unclassified Chitinophaga TaxID=2619133 RepID=UPI002DF6859A|nr:Esterase [Chitinophaga sp. 212800010-3]